MHRSILLLLPACCLLTACAAPTASVPPTTAVVTITPNPLASPTATPFQPLHEPSPTATRPAPTPTPTPPPTPAAAVRPHYTLTVALDYAAHTLTVEETILYPNQTGEALTRLMLAVEPNRWPGCFSLISLSVNGRPATTYTLTGGWLEVPLESSLPPGGEVTLTLHYALSMPWANADQIFGYNNLQLNAVDWYPFVLPYAPGYGWLQHEPTAVGEHLVYDVADFEVTIRPVGATTDLVIAASAPAAGEQYHLPAARNFAFSASPYFLSKSTTAAGVTVVSYYFETESGGGEEVLNQVARAVETYSRRFAPYPYARLSIVEAIYPDGVEQCGLFFLNRRFYTEYNDSALNNLVAIAVHEAAHNWWYGLVGNDQALEPWLDEALAVYSEYIFYSDNYPSLANAWWAFRVNAFKPAGWVDATIYNGGEFRAYTNAVYLQGARFLHALRQRMGEKAFFAFLQAYAGQMAYRRAGATEFFALARSYSPADFSDLVGAYFQNAP